MRDITPKLARDHAQAVTETAKFRSLLKLFALQAVEDEERRLLSTRMARK